MKRKRKGIQALKDRRGLVTTPPYNVNAITLDTLHTLAEGKGFQFASLLLCAPNDEATNSFVFALGW